MTTITRFAPAGVPDDSVSIECVYRQLELRLSAEALLNVSVVDSLLRDGRRLDEPDEHVLAEMDRLVSMGLVRRQTSGAEVAVRVRRARVESWLGGLVRELDDDAERLASGPVWQLSWSGTQIFVCLVDEDFLVHPFLKRAFHLVFPVICVPIAAQLCRRPALRWRSLSVAHLLTGAISLEHAANVVVGSEPRLSQPPPRPTVVDALGVSYWQDGLEVDVERVADRFEDPLALAAWLTKLGPRIRSLLARDLGLDPDLGIDEVRAELLRHPGQLLEALLIDKFLVSKTGYALEEVGRARLPEDRLEKCRMGSGRFDRLALAWSLFRQDPQNLELVSHLHRMARRGFARLVWKGDGTLLRDPLQHLTRELVQPILDRYEEDNHTRRQAVCAAALHDGGGNIRVFIKRDRARTFICHGSRNTFGFEPEWMVLEFAADLRRVEICSVSPDVPVDFANAIASDFFDAPVHYENEHHATDTQVVEAFLGALVQDPDTLRLVYVATKQSGLHSAPRLHLNARQGHSLALSLRQLAHAAGDLLSVANIAQLKVWQFNKRVKLEFELDTEGCVVRYGDQHLTGTERRRFEQMMHDNYGIKALSAEKRYAS